MNAAIILSIFDAFIDAAPFAVVVAVLMSFVERKGCAHVAAWIIGFVGLVVFAIVLDSTVAFFIAVGIFIVIYLTCSHFARKIENEKEESSNRGIVEIIESKPAICDETEDGDDIYADEEDDDDEEEDDDDSEGEMIDDDDHYCPVCGSSLLYIRENEYGNRRYHCSDCDGDFRESELIILSECCCPVCGGDDLYAFEDFDCENKFVCRDCHQKFEVDEIADTMG